MNIYKNEKFMDQKMPLTWQLGIFITFWIKTKRMESRDSKRYLHTYVIAALSIIAKR